MAEYREMQLGNQKIKVIHTDIDLLTHVYSSEIVRSTFKAMTVLIRCQMYDLSFLRIDRQALTSIGYMFY